MFQICVIEGQQEVFSGDFSGPVEIGRQQTAEEAVYSRVSAIGCSRVVLAQRDEQFMSRRHALLKPWHENKVLIENLSDYFPVGLPDRQLEPAETAEVNLPVAITIGKKSVRVQNSDAGTVGTKLQTLAQATVPPGRFGMESNLFATLNPQSPVAAERESLARWVRALMGVFQSAASSEDFFQKAARALVEMAGLDSGRVLLLAEENHWRTEAAWPSSIEESSRIPSSRILTALFQERRTFWELPSAAECLGSLAGVTAFAAAPILDRNGAVIGALYGDRGQQSNAIDAEPITQLQALLVELLASGVAAGLSRLEQERAAIAARVQFEQFFTPKLARQLAKQPDLLKGQQADVSVLFCDIRGFTRISERLGPVKTTEWISDVMNALSACVQSHAGVLVDYIGDELMAMWGAPEDQPNHAQLACLAGLEMQEQLFMLNKRWQSTLEESMDLGIGINSGLAQVGNTGSKFKFKYGPLGNTVNLGSRVQGATKYLRTRLLITGSTQAHLDGSFATRRLCRARVVNIEEAVELFELATPDQPGWSNLKTGYEQALEQFEQKNFHRTVQIVGNLMTAHPDDGPTVLLLARSAECLMQVSSEFSSIWTLPGK